MTSQENEPVDFEKVRQLLPPQALADLATLHGMDSDEARELVQQWPLGSRMVMSIAGLINQEDVGEHRLRVTLAPSFDEAARLAAADAGTV